MQSAGRAGVRGASRRGASRLLVKEVLTPEAEELAGATTFEVIDGWRNTPHRRLGMTSARDDTAKIWPDLAGRLIARADSKDGRTAHVLPVRVYFEDTDFSGIVYHASYVRWCERGRSDFLRLLGNDHKGLIAGGDGREPAAFVVRRLVLDYLAPARIDEVLEVTTRVKAQSAATLVLDQRIGRPATGGAVTELLCAEVTLVLVSQSGRVLRMSKHLQAAFEK
jgi:acyl-CoA thioester hydrolase